MLHKSVLKTLSKHGLTEEKYLAQEKLQAGNCADCEKPAVKLLPEYLREPFGFLCQRCSSRVKKARSRARIAEASKPGEPLKPHAYWAQNITRDLSPQVLENYKTRQSAVLDQIHWLRTTVDGTIDPTAKDFVGYTEGRADLEAFVASQGSVWAYGYRGDQVRLWIETYQMDEDFREQVNRNCPLDKVFILYGILLAFPFQELDALRKLREENIKATPLPPPTPPQPVEEQVATLPETGDEVLEISHESKE